MEVRFSEDVYKLLFDLQLSFRVFFRTPYTKKEMTLQLNQTYVPVDNNSQGIKMTFIYHQSSYRGWQHIIVDSQGKGRTPFFGEVEVLIEYDEQDVYKYFI